MDQDNATMTFMATAFILSPLRRLQLPNNLLIGFDTDISGIPVTCIVEDENIMRYMIRNNIVEGSVVRLIGNLKIHTYNMNTQLSHMYEKDVLLCLLAYTFFRTNDPPR